MSVAFAVIRKVVPSELDGLLGMVPDIVRSLEQKHGFQGFKLYVNRAESTLLTISQWASPEDLEADREYHQQMAQLLASKATIEKEETYEVVPL
jgi:quinol monooxygenase YgiN